MKAKSILDRARPYVQRVHPLPLRLAVAVTVFGVALLVQPRRTIYGSDGRYRRVPAGEQSTRYR